jgi:hypothetical protein
MKRNKVKFIGCQKKVKVLERRRERKAMFDYKNGSTYIGLASSFKNNIIRLGYLIFVFLILKSDC